ncbi:PEPxxWA-CTERM sorting domain-containing protein [Phenylobacterium sp.]|uniref:PEPxxWA-CTERM sorting domain-containing protein n=1 Tax=Phenylobacterium sp. TaxID=1871053 RepID=UPI0025E258FE|nr:PEPxxWA-CTERM sorting domain-containing protein [Phenylobacterium sp.]
MRRSMYLLAAIAAAAAGPALATDYQFTQFPVAGSSNTGVVAINDAGQILVGYGNPSSQGAFIYQGGVETPVAPPLINNGGNTSAIGVAAMNASGTVVGTDIQTTNGVGLVYDFVGFIDKGGQYTFVNAPGAVDTQLLGINNAGVVLGEYETAASNGVFTYFTDTNGVLTTLSAPGFSGIVPTGIDSAGDVVGTAMVGGVRVGFIDKGGVFSVVSVPGSGATSISGVSANGLIVGQYFSGGKNLGFLDDDGVFTTIAPPSATVTHISAVNDLGEVVGTANGVSFAEQGGVFSTLDLPPFDPDSNQGPDTINDAGVIGGSLYSGNGFNFEYTGFVATPLAPAGTGGVPEPAAWSLMIAGFGLAGAALRRRRLPAPA